MKKLTQEQYLEKCKEIHNDKYDYSLTEYVNISTKIKIICPIHGEFEQSAKKHKEGQGCPSCYGDININKEKFIKKYGRDDYDYRYLPNIIRSRKEIKIINKKTKLSYLQLSDHHKTGKTPTKIEANSLVEKLKEVHNNKYEYIIEKETYYATDKIKIINKYTTDEFLYRVDRHLNGMAPNKVTLNYFLLKAKEVHGDKYDYSLVTEVTGTNQKVKIICPEHGEFEQRVSNHINLKDGCPVCAGVGKWNTELLIDEFKKVHKDRYDYSLVEFENVATKVKIVCPEHGKFEQSIYKHLMGQGCTFCNNKSIGEEYVKMWLDDMEIEYKRQHTFDGCRYKNPLHFDFYLPNYNTCIEFDGIQHHEPVGYFGGEEQLIETKIRDNVKNEFCKDNNIDLIRIKYNEISKIKYILREQLKISCIKKSN